MNGAARRRAGFSRLEWVVLCAAGIGIVGLSALLARFPFSPATGAASEAVGVSERILPEVRRRLRGALVWENLPADAPIFRGDTIFVARGGSAALRFGDGAALALDDGTLVTIAGQPFGAPGVELDRGSLTVSAERQEVQVSLGSGVAAVQAGGVTRINIDERNRARVTVAAGQAELRGASTRKLATNQATELGPSGELGPLVTLPVELTAPEHDQRFFFTRVVAPVTLGWTSKTRAPLFVQIAGAPAFQQPLASTPAKGSGWSWTPAGPGTYWWRLINEWGEEQSDTRKFSVFEDRPPRLLEPTEGQVVEDANGVVFEWLGVEGVGAYQLELASEPTFAAPLVSEKVEHNRWRLARRLGEGVYHWRVKALDAERRGAVFSSPASFRFVVAPVLAPPTELDSRQLEKGRAQP